MFEQSDLPYFRARHKVESDAASAARDPASREAHLRLADHYADRVWALEEQKRRRALRA